MPSIPLRLCSFKSGWRNSKEIIQPESFSSICWRSPSKNQRICEARHRFARPVLTLIQYTWLISHHKKIIYSHNELYSHSSCLLQSFFGLDHSLYWSQQEADKNHQPNAPNQLHNSCIIKKIMHHGTWFFFFFLIYTWAENALRFKPLTRKKS